jgi:alkylation response protein AidB-like acyl-CoA dehydrogenase
MNFDTSEEQELLQETIRQFLEGECPPPRVREIFDGEGHDPALWKGMVELGLAGLAVPEEHGGAGLEILDLALVTEELGYGSAPGPFFGHSLATVALAAGGSEAQKQQWLPKLATGAAVGSVAFGEAGGAWLPEDWSVAGSSDQLSGRKSFVPGAELADLFVVGTEGGGLALVERGAVGVTVEPYDGVDRTRRMATLVLEGAAAERLESGAAAAPRLRDTALVLAAADAFGVASRLVDMSVAYAGTREQFGVTIGHFQALKHQLADMAVAIEPARGLWWFAAHALDHLPEEAPRAAALAKAHITDVAMQIARDAVEAHGGIGFTWECDVQIWFKRVLLDRAWMGSPDLHRERAAELAGW